MCFTFFNFVFLSAVSVQVKTRLKTRAAIPMQDKANGTKTVLSFDEANALNEFTMDTNILLPMEEFKGEIL